MRHNAQSLYAAFSTRNRSEHAMSDLLLHFELFPAPQLSILRLHSHTVDDLKCLSKLVPNIMESSSFLHLENHKSLQLLTVYSLLCQSRTIIVLHVVLQCAESIAHRIAEYHVQPISFISATSEQRPIPSFGQNYQNFMQRSCYLRSSRLAYGDVIV